MNNDQAGIVEALEEMTKLVDDIGLKPYPPTFMDLVGLLSANDRARQKLIAYQERGEA